MVVLGKVRECFCTTPAGFTEAVMVATAAHQHQRNKFTGEPYILHVMRVINNVPRVGIETEDNDLLSVAALHDVVEDTSVGLKDLLKMGFSEEVVGGVLSVTHYKNIETYEQFIMRAAANPLGKYVKVADLRDHLSTPEPRPGMHQRYSRALQYLLGYHGYGLRAA